MYVSICENLHQSTKRFFCLAYEETQKQLEEQYEQELEDSGTDNLLQDFSFSRKVIDMSNRCKEIAEHKVRLATQTYERVSI